MEIPENKASKTSWPFCTLTHNSPSQQSQPQKQTKEKKVPKKHSFFRRKRKFSTSRWQTVGWELLLLAHRSRQDLERFIVAMTSMEKEHTYSPTTLRH